VELSQRGGDAVVAGEEDEVVVVAHQRVGDEWQLELFEDVRKPLEEGGAVVVGQEEVTDVAPVRSEVVEPFGETTRRTRHSSRVGRRIPTR